MCFRGLIRTRMICGLVGVFALLLFPGCWQNPEAAALMEVSIDVPATLADGDTTWTRTEISASDQECLTTFFQKNQQLVGSPDMEGQPILFTTGKSDRRFYWMTAVVDGSRWTCVHFEKGRFKTTDGNGNPF